MQDPYHEFNQEIASIAKIFDNLRRCFQETVGKKTKMFSYLIINNVFVFLNSIVVF